MVYQRPRSHADWGRRLGKFLEDSRQCLDGAASFSKAQVRWCSRAAGMWVFGAKPSAIAGLRTRFGGYLRDRDTLTHWQAFRRPTWSEMLTSRLRENDWIQQGGWGRRAFGCLPITTARGVRPVLQTTHRCAASTRPRPRRAPSPGIEKLIERAPHAAEFGPVARRGSTVRRGRK